MVIRLPVLALALFLASCTALSPVPGATPTEQPVMLQSPQPQASATRVESNATPAELVDTPALPAKQTPECDTYQAELQLIPSASSLQIGETIILTATLSSSGCAMLGLPKYSLILEESDPGVLEPELIEPVLHYLGLNDGQRDTALFALHAAAQGSATIQAMVSFEVHLGYPGPAYWATAASQVAKLEVGE
jgi:hypothetical protein